MVLTLLLKYHCWNSHLCDKLLYTVTAFTQEIKNSLQVINPKAWVSQHSYFFYKLLTNLHHKQQELMSGIMPLCEIYNCFVINFRLSTFIILYMKPKRVIRAEFLYLDHFLFISLNVRISFFLITTIIYYPITAFPPSTPPVTLTCLLFPPDLLLLHRAGFSGLSSNTVNKDAIGLGSYPHSSLWEAFL